MRTVKPFSIGQKINCPKSVYSYPHDLKSSLIVDDMIWFELTFRTQRDITRNYFGYWRVYAHIKNRPEYTVDGNSRFFYIA